MNQHRSSDRPADPAFVGGLYALAAFTFWGAIPIYFKWVADIPAIEVLAHRVVWAVVAVAVVITFTRRWRAVRAVFKDQKLLGMLVASALFVSANWLTFIWAIANDRVLETSLGYFINPLVSVLFGVMFLGERLRAPAWAAVALAAGGVAFQVWRLGELPWVALTLAFSFGFYGLIRKVARVDAYTGLFTETVLLLPLAGGYLGYLAWTGAGAFGHGEGLTDFKLLLAGPVTAVPLILFAEGARRLRLSTIGFFQYIAPSLTFVLALWVYGEPFTWVNGVAFACIWAALAIYTTDTVVIHRHRARGPREAMPATDRAP